MKSFRETFITESSTLSSLGVTDAQLKTINSAKSFSIKHDAQWDKLKNKAEIKGVFTKNEQIVISVEKSGDLNTIILNNEKYYFRKISPTGEVLETDISSSYDTAIKNLTPGDYYTTKGAIIDTKADWGNTGLAFKISDLIGKEAERLFTEKKQEIADRTSKMIISGSFAEAYAILDKLIAPNGAFSKKSLGIKDLLSGYSQKTFTQLLAQEINKGPISNFGYYNTVDFLIKTGTPQEIRAAGAQVLKNIKQTLSEI